VTGAHLAGELGLEVWSSTPSRKIYRRDVSTAIVGDIIHTRATGRDHRAIWIYHDGELVAACPRDPECKSSDAEMNVAIAASRIGRYMIVALTSSSPIAAPGGTYDADVDGAQRAGAKVVNRKLDVR
jgi:hypothetical protein